MSARKYATVEEVSVLTSKIDKLLEYLTAKPATQAADKDKDKAAEAIKAKAKAKAKAPKVVEGGVPVSFATWDTMVVAPRDGSLWLYLSPEVDVAAASKVVFDALSGFVWYATVNSRGETTRKRSTRFYQHYEDGKLQYWHCHLGLIDNINQSELRKALTAVKPKLVKYVNKAETAKTTPSEGFSI